MTRSSERRQRSEGLGERDAPSSASPVGEGNGSPSARHGAQQPPGAASQAQAASIPRADGDSPAQRDPTAAVHPVVTHKQGNVGLRPRGTPAPRGRRPNRLPVLLGVLAALVVTGILFYVL